MPRDLDPFHEAIAGLYEGALDPQCWNDSMQRINSLFGLSFSMLGVEDVHKKFVLKSQFYGADRSGFHEGVVEYQQCRHRTDPTVRFVAENPRQGMIDSAVDFDRDDPHVLEHLRWNHQALGSERWLLCFTTTAQGLAIGFSAHFAQSDTAFKKVSKRDLVTVFGHMTRAEALAARAPLSYAGPDAVIVTDGNSRILALNAAAEAMARAGRLNVSFGRLQLPNDRANDQLHALIRNAVAVLDGAFVSDRLHVPATNTEASLSILVSPVLRPASPIAHLSAAAEIRIRREMSLQQTRPEIRWQRQFGFTPAEARLASQLLKTDGRLRNVAEELGISYATARVHLTRMFTKAEVRTQAQLVRALIAVLPRSF